MYQLQGIVIHETLIIQTKKHLLYKHNNIIPTQKHIWESNDMKKKIEK